MPFLKSAAHVSRRDSADVVIDADLVRKGALCTSQCVACGQRPRQPNGQWVSFLTVPTSWAVGFAAAYGGFLVLASMAPEFAFYHSTRSIPHELLVDVALRWPVVLPFIATAVFALGLLPFTRWRKVGMCTPCDDAMTQHRRRTRILWSSAILLTPLSSYLVAQQLAPDGGRWSLMLATAPALLLVSAFLWLRGRVQESVLDVKGPRQGVFRVRGTRGTRDALEQAGVPLSMSSWPKRSFAAGSVVVAGVAGLLFTVAGGLGDAMVCPPMLLGGDQTLRLHMTDGDDVVEACVAQDEAQLHGRIVVRRASGAVTVGGFSYDEPSGYWTTRGEGHDDASQNAVDAWAALKREYEAKGVDLHSALVSVGP